MSIIASAIVAGAVCTFTPQTMASEHEVVQYEVPNTNEVSCLTRSEIMLLDCIERKVEVLWAAHTNRLAEVEARKAANAERKSAVDRVRENARERKCRSAFGRSAGGVK